MPTLRDFQLNSCQASIFTPDAEVSAVRFLARLMPQWLDRFDAEPIVLPLPDGIPKDVPRITLQSRSGEWKCDVASARLNLRWSRAVAEVQPPTLAEFFTSIMPMVRQYVEFVDSRVGRLAAVITRYVENDAPARFLASHFCKERWLVSPLNRPESFELHAHKAFELAERLTVNSWVRNKTGMLTFPPKSQPKPIVVVEQDFNTAAEEAASRTFTMEDIERFFAAAAPRLDETLSLYYPPEAG